MHNGITVATTFDGVDNATSGGMGAKREGIDKGEGKGWREKGDENDLGLQSEIG
ncbi:Hypothetical predicted protein, partial [Olea europaea subsp. europaea]